MNKVLKEIACLEFKGLLLDPVKVRTGIDRVHLETALAVQFHGTFGKTAQSLNMKASTVNRRVRDLEFQLGTQIFERRGRRLVPTPSGLLFLRRSAEMLASFHSLVENVRRMADGRAGQIVIGYHGSFANGELYEILFNQSAQPEIRHVPVELPHDLMAEALAGGAIDAAIVRGKSLPAPHKYHALWEERLLIILPEDHPLAARSVLHWEDLADETFLISGYDPSEAICQLLEARLTPLNARPETEIHHIGIPAIMHMVGSGRGVCLCLDSIMVHHFAGTVFRELSGRCGPEYVPSFACWREDNTNPALKRFLKQLRSRFSNGAHMPARRTIAR